MIYYILRVIEKLLIIYFTIYFLIDIILYLYSLLNFRRKAKSSKEEVDYKAHPISIIVPSYNEEVSIITCTNMLLEIDYPSYELIIVNDGSTDGTMKKLKEGFKLFTIDKKKDELLNTKQIKQIYQVLNKSLIIIDKENGGKADSINAGINYAKGKYICTIDADSILDSNALKEVVKPFIFNCNTFVSGGQLAVANDVTIIHNKVVSSKTPTNIWVLWQITEYIKSFMISRIGLSKINALLIMSGAFSLFKKEDLFKIGGFITSLNTHPYIKQTIGLGKQTVCEDMEIVVRLWKYKRDNKIRAKAVFLPEPVCWTEVPDRGKNLFKQRSRWHQGLMETLKIHRDMIFEPKYGITGLIGLPYYFFFEMLAPIIKIFSFIFIVISALYGTINYIWIVLLILSVMLITAIIMSSITAIIEYWSLKQKAASRDALRYKNFADWLRLISAGILAEFSYSFYKIAAQTSGIINFLKKKNKWNKFERKGVKQI